MKFYRYYIWKCHSTTNAYIELVTYDLIRETPKGYWIGRYQCAEKWIPIISRKRFAYPNKDEALLNLVKRTEIRINHLENQLDLAKDGLKLAQNFVIV